MFIFKYKNKFDTKFIILINLKCQNQSTISPFFLVFVFNYFLYINIYITEIFVNGLILIIFKISSTFEEIILKILQY